VGAPGQPATVSQVEVATSAANSARYHLLVNVEKIPAQNCCLHSYLDKKPLVCPEQRVVNLFCDYWMIDKTALDLNFHHGCASGDEKNGAKTAFC